VHIAKNPNQMTLHTKAADQHNQPKVGQQKTAKNKRSFQGFVGDLDLLCPSVSSP
jgi:hypothetical protein